MSNRSFRFPINGHSMQLVPPANPPRTALEVFMSNIAKSAKTRANGADKAPAEWETALDRAHRFSDSGKGAEAADQYHRAGALIVRKHIRSSEPNPESMAEIASSAFSLSFSHYLECREFASCLKAAKSALNLSFKFHKHMDATVSMLSQLHTSKSAPSHIRAFAGRLLVTPEQ